MSLGSESLEGELEKSEQVCVETLPTANNYFLKWKFYVQGQIPCLEKSK